MKPKIKKLWTTALRSGTYEQGSGALRSQNGMCCLGILCDLHAQATGRSWEWDAKYDGDPHGLPTIVREWAELPDRYPRIGDVDITAFNDGDTVLCIRPHTFAEIADLIETHL